MDVTVSTHENVAQDICVVMLSGGWIAVGTVTWDEISTYTMKDCYLYTPSQLMDYRLTSNILSMTLNGPCEELKLAHRIPGMTFLRENIIYVLYCDMEKWNNIEK